MNMGIVWASGDFVEVLDHFKIRAALAINGSAIQAYQPIARARPWSVDGNSSVMASARKNMQKGFRMSGEDIAKDNCDDSPVHRTQAARGGLDQA